MVAKSFLLIRLMGFGFCFPAFLNSESAIVRRLEGER